MAWKRTHDIFREVGCYNVKWMFSPNVLWDKRTAKDDLYNYYPGAQYADTIGIDGYNFGYHHDKWHKWHKWQSYEQVFEKTIRACTKFNQPIWISEVGCADDRRKPVWIKDFLTKVSQDDRIEGFIYFNHYNPRKSELNWRFDSDSLTLKVFRDWAEDNVARKSER